ncbi:hypothetical protein FRB94_000990 [Tulasnella sp. JGI-2019a]|nr:hypothetical protein FRB94_000990 [Tulasnella sp. JGI-2019a]
MATQTLTQRHTAQTKGPKDVDVDNLKVEKYVVPNFTTKDLMSVIPPHCLKPKLWRSMRYFLQDVVFLSGFLYIAHTYIPKINPENVDLGHPLAYKAARFVAWNVYGFAAGLWGMGLFDIGHDCGHGAFSLYRGVNDIIGFLTHSFIGVPYFSWKITHKHHHGNTSNLQTDYPYVPYTRSEWSLPPINEEKENVEGTYVAEDLQEDFSEHLEYSPVFSAIWFAAQLIIGWWAYLFADIKSQRSYPMITNHFIPKAPLFAPHQWKDVAISNFGIALWLGSIVYSIKAFGFSPVFRIYLVPYIWTNHWIIFITWLNHTDPALPHYDQKIFTFARGALCTFDREMMGGHGLFAKICNYVCMVATHSVMETHVAHHVCSRIPHYYLWDAKAEIDKLLAAKGIKTKGAPATWSEGLRIMKETKFIEDTGDIRFYKNAQGKAAMVAVFESDGAGQDN